MLKVFVPFNDVKSFTRSEHELRQRKIHGIKFLTVHEVYVPFNDIKGGHRLNSKISLFCHTSDFNKLQFRNHKRDGG